MNPLSGLFAGMVAARNSLYDHGLLPAARLHWPVISIGNLSVGGTGKTPLTIELGEQLQQRQFPFDVLSRGYGRDSRGVLLVEEQGQAQKYGDEPLLITRKLHVPVIVGEDRYAAGTYAEKLFAEARPAHGKFWLHLLDDGFQHRRLGRHYDIVLLAPGDAEDQLLPAGRLREPLSALQRADAVVLSENAGAQGLPLQGKQLWRVSRELSVPSSLARGGPVLAFCGIARPEPFFRELRSRGLEIAAEITFPDHHRYGAPDIERLLRASDRYKAESFLTTEKDEINLGSLRTGIEPLHMATLRSRLIEPEAALGHILETVSRRWQPVS